MHPSVATLLGFVVGLIMPAMCFAGFAHYQTAIGIDDPTAVFRDVIAVLRNMAVTGLLPINVLLGGILGVLLSLATR